MRRASLLSGLVSFYVLALAGCGSGSVSKTPAITITVSPASASVAVNNKQQLTATVTGTSNTAVTWSVAGGASNGTITSTGLYTGPATVPNPPQVTVTATSQAGSTKSTSATVTVSAVSQASSGSGTATVTIQPGNENAQSGAIELGTSGGNANDSRTNTATHTITCCGATLGSLVTRGGTQYILSNTHVLARSDMAQLNDPIIEPGLIDTATCTTSGA